MTRNLMELLRNRGKRAQTVVPLHGVEIKRPLMLTSICHLNCVPLADNWF